jgi:SAM-dependent methyltransferase
MLTKPSLSPQFDPKVNYPLYLIRSRLLKALKKLAPQLKGQILDFGCGIKPYESLFDVDKYIGVDYVGEGETYSKEKVDFIYDGKTLPFSNESFDGIFSSEVAEHIFNLPDILKELNRVLKPGGKILLTCPFTMPEHEVPNDFARYTSFAIKAMLEENGFTILQYEKTGNFVESVHQLYIIYLDQSILKIFGKIPILRTVIRTLTYVSLNLSALFISKVFPTNKGLYLNNIVLAQKVSI